MTTIKDLLKRIEAIEKDIIYIKKVTQTDEEGIKRRKVFIKKGEGIVKRLDKLQESSR
jgi:hypothetical protein